MQESRNWEMGADCGGRADVGRPPEVGGVKMEKGNLVIWRFWRGGSRHLRSDRAGGPNTPCAMHME